MLHQLFELGPFQWAGLFFGLIYIIFAVRNQPVCWIFGIISCLAIALEDFFKTRLYSDGFLQVFYVFLGIYGLWQWKSGGISRTPLPVARLDRGSHLIIIVVCSSVSLMIGYIVRENFNAAFPFLDGFTTIFSIAASFLLVYRKIDNWIYWVVIDIAYVYLYTSREAPLFAILYGVFTVLAVLGYFNWRKQIQAAI